MTQAPLRAPSYLQPRLKAPPTFSNTSHDTLSASNSPQVSRASSRSRRASPSQSQLTAYTSDKATAALVRRTLCPNAQGSQAIDELLPPLTSSNDVDLQLYAIISIVVKEFVYSWYGKITPDQGFVEEVVKIIAHCTRALEQRIRSVDIEGLVFDEIPELLESHIDAYKTSHLTFYSSNTTTEPRVIYHSLIPHPAFSPVPDSQDQATVMEQSANEAVYRQLLVQGALAILLPTEDLENACLRTLVADVVAESILGSGISGRACQGWLIWQAIGKIAENVNAQLEAKATGQEIESDTKSRLARSGLLAKPDERTTKRPKHARTSVLAEIFWRVLQYGYLVFIFIRFTVLGLFAASSKGQRSPKSPILTAISQSPPTANSAHDQVTLPKRPILTYKIFSATSKLLDLPLRAPWLSGSLSLLQYQLVSRSLRIGATDGILDK
ncbi:hypothetical protein MMC09_001867 [Bachmanniomyces sp. S44760]|nr:hypothetical protein [Bachmanniomyces sp. S44760]